MTAPMAGPPPTTALQLMLTAERLFAERGLDGVSLRQISTIAGSSNNSAIQYHFGSKGELLRAIFTYRLGDLMQRRALLKARANPDDLREQLEAHILPLLELAESPESSYVSFIEQLQRAGNVDVLLHQPEAVRSQDEFAAEMQRMLPHLPEPVRSLRVRQAQDLGVHLAAERERALKRDDSVVPFALFVSAVVDGLYGFLSTPASPETEQIVSRTARRPRRSAEG